MTPSLFLKINFSPNKNRVLPSSGDACEKRKSTKWWLHWGCLEGQTWAWVEGNVMFDWSISGYPFLCVFVWLSVDYTLRALICLFVLHVWLLLFIEDVHILIISIDSLTYFCIVILHVVWLSCFPWHVYSHFCMSHSYWCDWFSLLYIILFISTYCLFLLYTYLVSCLVCV